MAIYILLLKENHSFLPLSFFTSLFGVNVREWSGEETNPDWAYMLAISGPSSSITPLEATIQHH